MTNDILDKYYKENIQTYQILSLCTSVDELLLKIQIFGNRWIVWDWALFFTHLSVDMHRDISIHRHLLDDIIEAIDTSNVLDEIITNKNVLLTTIQLMKSSKSEEVKSNLCTILQHIFKKFNRLWSMSWMYSTFKDQKTKKRIRYHKLKNFDLSV